MNVTMKYLQEGDIIELDERHRVYHTRKVNFYGGKTGTCHTETSIKDFPELKGRYLVERVTLDGGGTGHGPHDVYPDGHHVYCTKLEYIKDRNSGELIAPRLTKTQVDFYQSGCFSIILNDVKVIGSARQVKYWQF